MKSRKQLFLFILIATMVRIPWMFLIPHMEAPDENTHFWVIQFIVKNLRLPDYQAVVAAGPQAVYGSIPQFGYLPHILALKLLSPFVLEKMWIYAARVGSLLAGLVVVTLAYYLGQILFAKYKVAALSLPLMVMFHPQFVFVNAYINNDSTVAALSSVIIFVLINAARKGLTKINALLLAVLSSWLILSKYSGYCLLVTIGIVLLMVLYRHRSKLKEQLFLSTVLAVIVVLLSSWWFVRNNQLFNGDVTGVETMHHIWTATYHRHVQNFDSPIAVLLSTRFWRMLFFSFWGWFGYMTRELPRLIYYGYLFFVIASALLCIKHFAKGKISEDWFVIFVCVAVNFAICIFGSYSGVAGPQGRYLFPSEIPIMACLIGGLAAGATNGSSIWSAIWSRNLIISMLAYNIFVYFYASFYLWRLYS